MSDLRLGALAAGAVLLLAAVFAVRLAGAALRTRGGTVVRALVGLGGAALIGWALSSFPGARSPAPSPPAASSTPPHAPVDLVDAASVALEACARPTAPALPNGAMASLQEMTAARAAFQAYDTATNAYVHCVDATTERIARQYAAVASQDELRSLKEFGLGAHDTAIDQEQAVADQFNAQVRLYKSKHPQS